MDQKENRDHGDLSPESIRFIERYKREGQEEYDNMTPEEKKALARELGEAFVQGARGIIARHDANKAEAKPANQPTPPTKDGAPES